MYEQHKKKIIAGIAAAFLAALAVFYEGVIAVVTDVFINTEETVEPAPSEEPAAEPAETVTE